MCGIALLLQQHRTTAATEWTVGALEAAIAPRGPDQQGRVTLALDHDWSLVLLASVLHMRGPRLCPQPAQDEAGNVLLWNGEVFAGRLTEGEEGPEASTTTSPGLGESDTEAVLKALGGAWEGGGEDKDDEHHHHQENILLPSPISRHVRRTLANVQGPWAMIYYHKATQTVHFGRDRLGRRSLVMHVEGGAGGGGGGGDEWLAVASTSAPVLPPSGNKEGEREGVCAWEEVKVNGLWCLNLSSLSSSSTSLPSPQLVPWTPPSLSQEQQQVQQPLPTSLPEAADMLFQTLGEAVRRRVVSAPMPLPFISSSSLPSSSLPLVKEEDEMEEERRVGPPARVAVLYSGGLDCQVLAALAHLQLTKEEEAEEDAAGAAASAAAAPIDLINVCFDYRGGHQSPDRLAALAGWLELRGLFPSRRWRLLLVDIDDYEKEVKGEEGVVKRLILPCHTPMDFNIACAFFHAVRGVGREVVEEEEAREVLREDGGEGLLRYGGRGGKEEEGEEGREERKEKEVPGPCSVAVCRRVFKPGCRERLCGNCCMKAQKKAFWLATGGGGGGGEVGVVELQEQQEQQEQQQQRQPCRVHKLGKKWFVPQTNPPSPTTTAAPAATSSSPLSPPSLPPSSSRLRYRSRARVVLLGLGADEQLAGYGRHRSTFLKGGEEALARELEMDMRRLWTR